MITSRICDLVMPSRSRDLQGTLPDSGGSIQGHGLDISRRIGASNPHGHW